MFTRQLIIDILDGQSIFLWGARQTGKSQYLLHHYPKSAYFDFLKTKNFLRYQKTPDLFSEDILSLPEATLQHPIIVDEIQKIPILLNEIHWLIENKKLSFILCGSSARKLKTQSTNLLGGRAWVYHFYPLIFPEVPQIDLLKVLQHGLLPKNYLLPPTQVYLSLKSYVEIYLTDEIRNEGLVRDLSGFSRFLDIAGLCNSELINFSNIARDCHIDRNTVRDYFQILIDTWLGYYIFPFHKKIKRDLIIATPKFYLFDVGVANYLAARTVTELRGDAAGKSFEHYIFMELWAYKNMHQKRFDIFYWRTKAGHEVDFVIGNNNDARLAIEVKITPTVHKSDLAGLIAFCEEHPKAIGIVISQDDRERKIMITDNCYIAVIPWRLFLEQWWMGKFLRCF